MKEQWKVVPGFERYQVSTLGRIKIFRDNQWEIHLRKIRMSTVDKYINIHPTALVKLSKYFSVTIEDFINPPAMKEILKQSA